MTTPQRTNEEHLDYKFKARDCDPEEYVVPVKRVEVLLATKDREWQAKLEKAVVESYNIGAEISTKEAVRVAVEEARKEEHQFFLNILDGADTADAQMGNTGGGTQAIRHALKSRCLTTPTETLLDK